MAPSAPEDARDHPEPWGAASCGLGLHKRLPGHCKRLYASDQPIFDQSETGELQAKNPSLCFALCFARIRQHVGLDDQNTAVRREPMPEHRGAARRGRRAAPHAAGSAAAHVVSQKLRAFCGLQRFEGSLLINLRNKGV